MNKNLLNQCGFGKAVQLVEVGKCAFCAKQINIKTEFRDELSRKEFEISNLCQKCQDNVFN